MIVLFSSQTFTRNIELYDKSEFQLILIKQRRLNFNPNSNPTIFNIELQ